LGAVLSMTSTLGLLRRRIVVITIAIGAISASQTLFIDFVIVASEQ